MEKLENIFHPQIGLLTHIGTAHLANFQSEEELIDEKIKLFKHSETVIYNGDNSLVDKKIKELYSGKKLISYGFKEYNQVYFKNNISKNEDVTVHYFDEEISFPVHQRDEATLTNALALVTVLKELGIENEKIVEKINALKAVEMRLEAIEGIKNNIIINDSFNLDLDSLKTALQFLNEYNKPKKSLVLTDIVGVNSNSKELYEEVSELVNEQKFDSVFLIGDEISKFSELFKSKTFTFINTQN
jgi:alanine racemase